MDPAALLGSRSKRKLAQLLHRSHNIHSDRVYSAKLLLRSFAHCCFMLASRFRFQTESGAIPMMLLLPQALHRRQIETRSLRYH